MDRLRTTVSLEHRWSDLERAAAVLAEAYARFAGTTVAARSVDERRRTA
jgi:hypothetical protein